MNTRPAAPLRLAMQAPLPVGLVAFLNTMPEHVVSLTIRRRTRRSPWR